MATEEIRRVHYHSCAPFRSQSPMTIAGGQAYISPVYRRGVQHGTIYAKKWNTITESTKKQMHKEIALTKLVTGVPHFIQYVDTYIYRRTINVILLPWCSSNLTKELSQSVETKELSQSDEFSKFFSWMFCMAAALWTLHMKCKVKHLDLKPDNVLLYKGEIVIADFGYSQSFTSESKGVYSGLTEFYRSPEQLAGDATVGRQSDIFSLGIIFLEILAKTTGKLSNSKFRSQFGGAGVAAYLNKKKPITVDQLLQNCACNLDKSWIELFNGMLLTEPSSRWNISTVVCKLQNIKSSSHLKTHCPDISIDELQLSSTLPDESVVIADATDFTTDDNATLGSDAQLDTETGEQTSEDEEEEDLQQNLILENQRLKEENTELRRLLQQRDAELAQSTTHPHAPATVLAASPVPAPAPVPSPAFSSAPVPKPSNIQIT